MFISCSEMDCVSFFNHDRKVTEHDKLLDLEVKNSTLGDVGNEKRAPSFGCLGDLLGMEILHNLYIIYTHRINVTGIFITYIWLIFFMYGKCK